MFFISLVVCVDPLAEFFDIDPVAIANVESDPVTVMADVYGDIDVRRLPPVLLHLQWRLLPFPFILSFSFILSFPLPFWYPVLGFNLQAIFPLKDGLEVVTGEMGALCGILNLADVVRPRTSLLQRFIGRERHLKCVDTRHD